MHTETLNYQRQLDKDFDDLSISQILITYAAPHQQEKPRHEVRALEKLLNEVISNRGFYEGNSRQRGEHEMLIKELIGTQEELSDLYPTRHHFSTQLEKVSTLISYLGHEQFTQKALERRFTDKETVKTIRNMYLQVMKKTTDPQRTLHKNKKGQQQDYAGTIEEMATTKIDVDLLIYKNLNLQKHLRYPWAFLVKYGKSGRSAAKKIGEYVANSVTALHNGKKRNDVSIHTYDPGIALSYATMRGEAALHDPLIRRAFGIRKNEPSPAREALEGLVAHEERRRHEEEKLKPSKGERIQQEKEKKQYTRTILTAGAQQVAELDEEAKQNIMRRFYLQAGHLEDIRGLAVVKQQGIEGAPHFKKHPYYKQGSHEQHNDETNDGKRKYHSEHAKVYTRMLEKQEPKRWRKLKEKRLIELQKEDISGLILDLLGPDNRTKYDSSKKHVKYSFNAKQDRLRTQMEERIAWLAEPLDEALEQLLATTKSNPTKEEYEQELTRCARYMHEQLYNK